ncbi:MAG: hypothetical protein AAGD06_22235, partial [Acidobacteriota bacterium]
NAGLPILEIVHIRCTEATYRRAESALVELLAASEDLAARLVRSVDAPHDLALHLRSGFAPSRGLGASPLGLRIAAELRDLGPVSHSVWTDIHWPASEAPLAPQA